MHARSLGREHDQFYVFKRNAQKIEMRRFYSDITFAFNSFGRPFFSWMLGLTLSNTKSPKNAGFWRGLIEGKKSC
jgi:hypothetical protein